jgi:hypothetical protein
VNATQPGTFIFQDFALDSTITFFITDLDQPGCTYEVGPMVYTRDSCVINSCGLDNYIVCYENNEDRWYTFRADGNVPVAIHFYEGQMLPNDNIVIYNGISNNTQNVIFQGNNGGNLAGISVSSANSQNALTLRIRSNGEGSCADGQATIPLRWDVGCGFVGVFELEASTFNIYPNPTTGVVMIQPDGSQGGPTSLRVMDLSGRKVFEKFFANQGEAEMTVDLGLLGNGQYMVQLITKDSIGTRSLQIMH